MHYEALSRALAYISCFSSMTLFATSMAIAAVNVGKLKPQACAPDACAVHTAKAAGPPARGAPHIETIAVAMWPKKI